MECWQDEGMRIRLLAVAAALCLAGCRFVSADPDVAYACDSDLDCAPLEQVCVDRFCRAPTPDEADAGCTPSTCESLAYSCGTHDDGCGGQLDCGQCQSGSGCAAQGTTGICEACETADPPDDAYMDSNCDGIDGVASESVFVDPAGDDASAGTREAPVKTVARALMLAADGRPILISKGIYMETLTVQSGPVNLHGGYARDDGWSRSAQNEVLIRQPASGAQILNVTDPVLLDHVILEAADASNPTQRASIALRVSNATDVRLRQVRLAAGAGLEGESGIDGPGGADGGQGQTGGVGTPGNGGAQGCSSAGNGGGGGLPGFGASDGTPGAGATNGGPGGDGGISGKCSINLFAAPGQAGGSGSAGPDGSDGTAGASMGTWDGGVYHPASGTQGTFGTSGRGGGGGGGGGGNLADCNLPHQLQTGGGGGGGGGGGCGGFPGQPGTGGGPSVALMVTTSSVTSEGGVVLATKGGGEGGGGGNGGPGGAGGAGGFGSQGQTSTTRPGGNGGAGGAGGRGGHAGGGGGGPSVGVWCFGDAGVSGALTFELGPGGAGGPSMMAVGDNGVQQQKIGCP